MQGGKCEGLGEGEFQSNVSVGETGDKWEEKIAEVVLPSCSIDR